MLHFFLSSLLQLLQASLAVFVDVQKSKLPKLLIRVCVCVCVCVCWCIEEKERGVLGVEWLLSAVHICVGLLNVYTPRPDLPSDHSQTLPC